MMRRLHHRLCERLRVAGRTYPAGALRSNPGMPPTSVVMIGRPTAIASIITSGRPSFTEENTKTSRFCNVAGEFPVRPSSRARPSSPSLTICAASGSCESPYPGTNTQLGVRRNLRHLRKGVEQDRMALRRHQPPDGAKTKMRGRLLPGDARCARNGASGIPFKIPSISAPDSPNLARPGGARNRNRKLPA